MIARIAALLVALLVGVCALPVAAQTCASPEVWHVFPGGTPPLTGTTCGHETGIISVCQGAGSAPAQAFVVGGLTVTADAPFTQIDFTGGGGYTLSAYLVPQSSGCNADAACTTVGDGSTNMLHGDIPPGTYYLIITGADFDPPNACGPFTASADGPLPVTLLGFSVD
ncbi:hypothetical protein [Dokdonella sp.]|uniref:hypothetical protein n=1 Tax=Dokdonella sp. TaxID=2291710 RepID=UPI002F419858